MAGGVADQPAPQQFRIEVVVCKGDPLGSKAEGNVQHMAEPSLSCFNGQTAFFMAGGNDGIKGPNGKSRPFGVKLEFRPTRQLDGTIRLAVATTVSEPWEGPGPQAGGEDSVGVTERTYRHTRVVKAGEKFRVRLGADSPGSQLWAEVTVREERPQAAAPGCAVLRGCAAWRGWRGCAAWCGGGRS